jgi:RimJ/RimL family protein N-acetyltransferase
MGEEMLRDGSNVVVRDVRPDDRELFVKGFEDLSEESRYRRFMFHKKGLREKELDFFTQVDHHDHEAIGAIDPETGQGIGVARMVRCSDDPAAAEAAVTVVDAWQGRGVGALLLERLAERAREVDVQRFRATLQTGNKAMAALFDRLGCMRSRRGSGDQLSIDVELPVAAQDDALAAALRSAAAGDVTHTPDT